MKKKLTRSSFSALRETSILLDEREQRAVVGGDYWDDHGVWTTDSSGNMYWTRTSDGGGYYYGDSGGYYSGSSYYSGSGDYGGSGYYGASGYYGDSGYYSNSSVESNPWYAKWDSLSDDEKAFISNNPGFAFEFYRNSEKAFEKTESFTGQHNGYGDAVRHCYWSALNQVDTGYSLIPYAELYGNAHENNPHQPQSEVGMDLYNNGVGYELGKRALREGWSEEQLYQECLNAANQGRLQLNP